MIQHPIRNFPFDKYLLTTPVKPKRSSRLKYLFEKIYGRPAESDNGLNHSDSVNLGNEVEPIIFGLLEVAGLKILHYRQEHLTDIVFQSESGEVTGWECKCNVDLDSEKSPATSRKLERTRESIAKNAVIVDPTYLEDYVGRTGKVMGMNSVMREIGWPSMEESDLEYFWKRIFDNHYQVRKSSF